ncbi:MAG TPA: hypothetical protein VF258_06370 [Luteolibacter sp.]
MRAYCDKQIRRRGFFPDRSRIIPTGDGQSLRGETQLVGPRRQLRRDVRLRLPDGSKSRRLRLRPASPGAKSVTALLAPVGYLTSREAITASMPNMNKI